MKDILWKLATKQLKCGDWKKLALYWKFTAEHVRSIEHQYTGAISLYIYINYDEMTTN